MMFTPAIRTSLVCLLAFFGLCVPSQAQEHGKSFHSDKRHHFSFVFAGTEVFEEEEEDDPVSLTFGGDYEYRLNRLFGIGVVAEHAFGDIDATTLLAVTDIHLWRGFAIQTGPGVEFIDGEARAVGRIGGLYEVEIDGGFTLSPQLHYDISQENSLVFGLAIGRAF